MWKTLIGIGVVGFAFGAPVVPVKIDALCFYGYPLSEEQHVVGTFGCSNDSSRDGTQPQFTDIDGDGFISVAKYKNVDGTISFVQLPNGKFRDLKKPGGFKNNPTKSDAESIIQAITRPALAAIAQDAVSEGTTAGTSLVYAHTTSGSNRAITTHIWNQATNGVISSVTYNSVAETEFTNVTCPNHGTGRKVSVYGLLAPTLDANNVSIDRDTTAGGSMESTSVSYVGISQDALPTGTAINSGSASANDGSLGVTVVTAATNSITTASCVNNQVQCGNGTGTSAEVVDSGDIQTFNSEPLIIAAAGNFTMNFTGTGSGTADSECAVVVAFAPAPDAGGGGAEGPEIRLGF